MIVVDALLPPLLTLSMRKRKVTYIFVDEHFASEFAMINGGEVETG